MATSIIQLNTDSQLSLPTKWVPGKKPPYREVKPNFKIICINKKKQSYFSILIEPFRPRGIKESRFKAQSTTSIEPQRGRKA